jgi:hypothetical protein
VSPAEQDAQIIKETPCSINQKLAEEKYQGSPPMNDHIMSVHQSHAAADVSDKQSLSGLNMPIFKPTPTSKTIKPKFSMTPSPDRVPMESSESKEV